VAPPTATAPEPQQGVLLEGDCLERVPELIRRDSDRFDLVYVDPPFNAGGTRGARLERGERVRGAHAYRDAWGGLDAFLVMLEPRLVVIRDATSERGSLWLHLDHRAVHDAKPIADRVFGRAAFRGEIVWTPGNGARRRNGPSVTHQTILIYGRGRDLIWNDADPSLREPYADTSLAMHFGNVDASGRRFRERVVNGKTYRYYADQGRRLGSVWTDCPAMRANTPLVRETTGYPTQKPERLLERIVRLASLPDSRVLDPMCGSGTTLAVARRLGRRWAGVDLSPVACRVTRARLANCAADGRAG
jgi:site-specific DNA-methyltransferase (adenine-specific)